MKKIWLWISLLFMFPSWVDALSLECPTIASAGEEITCTFLEDKWIGIKANYQFDSVFTYSGFQNLSSWKEYYHGMDGFSVGNVLKNANLEGEIRFKVDVTAISGEEYEIGLVEVEGCDENYLVQELEDVSCKIKIVSDINTLEKLAVSGGTINPSFDKNILSYQTTIYQSSTIVSATLTDENAKLEGDIGEVSLNYGINIITVKVTSVRGNVREYQIYITRPFSNQVDNNSSLKSHDATLKSVTLSKGKISFKKDVYWYQVTVKNEVKRLEVEAIPNDYNAKVEIVNPEELVVGENKILIKVTAEDGTVLNYVIVVVREKALSSDARIRYLNVYGYAIYFQEDVYEYEIEINQEEKLDIEVELWSEFATYKITGNSKLRDGSTITIEVKAEDGSILKYLIHIQKSSDEKSSSIADYIKVIPLIGFIFLISIVLIVKKIRMKMSEKNVL